MNGELCKGCKYLEDEKCDMGHPCVNGSEYTPHSYHADEELINQFAKGVEKRKEQSDVSR